MKALGLMSGTSMDGIDAALIETDGEQRIQRIQQQSLRYPSTFMHQLKAMEYAMNQVGGDEALCQQQFSTLCQDYAHAQHIELDIADYDNVIQQSTDYHAQLIAHFSDYDLIAYHGQTIFHEPQHKSLQIGDPQKLANQFHCQVITQFRQADINAGGQGAPLAPIYHQALSQSFESPIAIVNCGGIANITVIDDDIMGFDTGPGNVLIDRYIRQHTQHAFDKDGQFGLKGKLQPKLLDALFQKSCRRDFFKLPPPKSLDSYDFHLIEECKAYDFNDVCHTLEIFTAKTMALPFNALNLPMPKVMICAGGGFKNPVIFNALTDEFPKTQFKLASELWQDDFIEAELMAYLGVRRLKELPITFPKTTGVSQPLIGGEIILPSLAC